MIRYRRHPNYKYQLDADTEFYTQFRPSSVVETPFISLGVDGRLVVRAGYAWDGPSGPTIDTRNFLRGSLCHDALYQLMREGELPRTDWHREKADALLRSICIEDGMSRLRAWWVYHGVRVGGGSAVLARQDHRYQEVLVAP